MAGPSQFEKLKFVASDSSYKTKEGFDRLGKNILIVVVLGATTWLACTILKVAIMYSTHILFSPFSHGEKIVHDYEYLTQETAVKLEKVKDSVETDSHEILEKVETAQEEKVASVVEEDEEESSPTKRLLYTLFFGGLIRGILIRRKGWQRSEGDGATQTINHFLESYAIKDEGGAVAKHRYERPTFLLALKRLVMTFLTLGCGGSGGLEGPVIPVGESIAAGWAKRFGIYNTDDLRAFQMAGIAAAVCTLLNAPFASAIFAAEIVYSERIVYRTLLYSIFSVIIAFKLNTLFMGQGKLFVVSPHSINYGFLEYLNVVIVAIVCSGPVGVGLNMVFKYFKTQFNYIPVLARAPIGALCAGLIAITFWYLFDIEPNHILGMGEETIEDILYGVGNPKLQYWWILILIIIAKSLATGLTLMTGGSAGLLIPAMVLGGCMGATLHSLFGFTTGIELFVVSGVGSALVSIIEIPISSVLIIISIFGDSYAAPAMLSVAVCHLLVKNYSLYIKHK